MVDFVNILVKRAPMEGSMGPIMPCIFQDEEYGDLGNYGEERGKRYASRKAKIQGRWVE